MPIIRNPFRTKDENVRPATAVNDEKSGSVRPSLDISREEKARAEYKLSEINDSGVCLPPSPGEEKKTFWGRGGSSRSTTTTSSAHRSLLADSEPFNISRESFDSYRRSFDISGRSPVIGPNEGTRPRASLDSRAFQPLPRSSATFARSPLPSSQQAQAVPQTTKEEDFEDVGLEDPKPMPAKKRGLFARLTDSNPSDSQQATAGAEAKTSDKWHFGARKRGQSGQGAELGSIPTREETPKPESGLRRSETPKPVEGTAQAPSVEAAS
ncbi:hypothetical protein B0A48_02798 [Cryoendolithus antarcticus]|uniref:Uncharacterized protein n=1 Tax=Cryoendolithus antarcticus TaxID=1507870 RepID=A0A1V8TLR2_9PEZI|nr:hypothetical protein B0A48_02798 [Cryoendolithus antarcticus]